MINTGYTPSMASGDRRGEGGPRAPMDTFGERPTDVGTASTLREGGEPDSPPTAAAVESAADQVVPARTTSMTPSSALDAGAMVGEYRIEKKLGEGGMGTVHGAVHPLIGKRAAIKVLRRQLCNDPAAVERFVLEARSVNQIGHANIVDIFAFGELDDGRCYFVMEWLRGESLGERMRRGRLGFGEGLEILDEVIRGLDAAHDKGIIHRDLKPDNVFLVEVRGQRPAVKLLDFGIAKLTADDDNRLERTRTGALIGTPQYISPEQARGLAIDHRADIYSLGVMAFEMFTGRPPFQADTAMDMIAKHLHEEPPRPSTVAVIPFELDRLIHEMLDKDPANRPDLTALRALIDELRSASVNIALIGTVPDISVPSTVKARRQRRSARLAAVVTAIGLAGAAGLWVAVRGRGDGAPRSTATSPTTTAPATTTMNPAPTTAAPSPLAVPAADVAMAAPATGTLVLSIAGGEPDLITIDGTEVPPAHRIRIERPAGRHELRVSAPGRKLATLTVELIAGQTHVEELRLNVADRPAGARRTSSPATKRRASTGTTTTAESPAAGSAAPPPPRVIDDDKVIRPEAYP